MLSLISLGCILLAASVLILLERLFPYTPGQPFLRKGFVTDVFWYGIVQSVILGFLISSVLIGLRTHFTFLHTKLFSGVAPVWQVLFFLVLHDFYIYCFHSLQHKVPALWRIHELHHSNTQVDWIAGARSHSLEILINQSIEFAPMYFLGASPEVIIIKGCIDGIWGMYIHSNINVRSGLLQLIINGPEMHRWHHADGDIHAYNKNFSTKLAIWDWIFGTAYLPQYRKAQTFGISKVVFPENYFRQHLHSFRRHELN